MQRKNMVLAAAALGFAAFVGGAPAQAAPMSQSPLEVLTKQITLENAAAQTVHYRGRRYCRSWRWTCADRWGWHTPRYRRCLRRHGC